MTDTWTQKTDYNATTLQAVSFTIGNYGYVASDYDTKYFWEYNSSTNLWTQKADYGGVSTYYRSGFAIGNYGYLGLGESSEVDFWEYNSSTNIWTQKTDFGGVGRDEAIDFSIGTKGYIGTGYVGLTTSLKDLWEYDQSTNLWTQKANLSLVDRYGAASFVINNKGYVGCGYSTGYLEDFWEYDPSLNIWTQKANYGYGAISRSIGFSIGNRGYFCCGTNSSGVDIVDFWEYNPSSDSWIQKTDFSGVARTEATAFSIGKKGYVGTGASPNSKDFWEWCCGSYNISGITTKSNGDPHVGITIRVTNNTTSEYADDTTNASGEYSIDLLDLTSGYSNGDSVTVRCYSIERNIIINETLYPDGQTVNLVCFNNFKVDGANINNIISTKVKKTIDNMAWQSETLLENKSGYRSNDFVTGQDLEVEIDGTILLKGEVSDVDLSKQHLLKIVGYNYTDDLNKRYVTSSFTSKSIYYAITDAVDGLIPNFTPGITTTNVANDVNTQQTFTKDFDEDSVSDALSWLGNLASSLGYIYYIDNDKDLHFYERKSVDSGITLTNTGANRSVLSWKWRNYSGDDLYNRIRVIGTGVDVTRNDISSQSFYGIREHPPITDLGITTTAAANEVGDNLLDKFANPGKNIDLKISTNTSAGDIFGLEPGDLVRVTLVGSGISGDNPFPWTFPMFFDPTLKMIQSIEHQFPQFVTTLKLTDYYKDLSTLITSTTK